MTFLVFHKPFHIPIFILLNTDAESCKGIAKLAAFIKKVGPLCELSSTYPMHSPRPRSYHGNLMPFKQFHNVNRYLPRFIKWIISTPPIFRTLCALARFPNNADPSWISTGTNSNGFTSESGTRVVQIKVWIRGELAGRVTGLGP